MSSELCLDIAATNDPKQAAGRGAPRQASLAGGYLSWRQLMAEACQLHAVVRPHTPTALPASPLLPADLAIPLVPFGDVPGHGVQESSSRLGV